MALPSRAMTSLSVVSPVMAFSRALPTAESFGVQNALLLKH
jgi:hypothetical protein